MLFEALSLLREGSDDDMVKIKMGRSYIHTVSPASELTDPGSFHAVSAGLCHWQLRRSNTDLACGCINI